MRRLVREEGDLREQDAEGSGDEQLEPAVAQQDESGDRAAEAEGDRAADECVEPGRSAEESAFADDLRDIRVRPRDRRELGCAGVGLANGSES
ncbi:hypothetical protein QE381_003314 [Microbacterium sp. SORGH_AS 888]|nr:hypothetical protein [Microbacterium sp. SORGH_AS_0888]